MYSAEWKSAFLCQLIIIVTGLIVSRYSFGVPFKVAFWAAMLFNIMPIMVTPGFGRWLFLSDFLIPLLGLLLLSRYVHFRVFMIALLAIFLWPLICTFLGVSIERFGYAWVMYLYRRLGCLVFLAAGASGVVRGITARHFFDACTVLWLGMVFAGLLQYLGVLSVDFRLEGGMEAGVSVAESITAQHGFMGFNRGAVGVCGATIATYCITVLFLEHQLGVQRFLLYSVTVALTYTVILFSGSRTGLVACLAGLGFVVLRCLLRLGQVRLARVIGFTLIALVVVVYFVAPTIAVVGGRVQNLLDESLDESSGGRVGLQVATIKYVLSGLRPAIVGMGGGAGMHFTRMFRAAHSHSEYIDILWETGILGLLLYLLFLWKLYRSMRPVPGEPFDIMGLAGQTVLFAGMVCGLAIGNIMITSSRLATFGYTMCFAYGLILNRFGQNHYALDEFDDAYYYMSEHESESIIVPDEEYLLQ